MTRAAAAALAASGLPRGEARTLLAHVLGVPRERLIARPEIPLAAAADDAFMTLAQRRRGGEPMAYLLGEQPFYGRSFRVTPDVLIPRPDTETLIEAALSVIAGRNAPRVLDLGTGSGCIAITLKLERPDAQVEATDASAAALEVARHNAAALGAEVKFRLGDWYDAVAPAAFDLIVSNPPYIAAGDRHLQGLAHEPMRALTDGADGLRHLFHLIDGARACLQPGGWIVLEHGYDQSEDVVRRLVEAGLQAAEPRLDTAGHRRVALARASDRPSSGIVPV